MKGPGNEKRKLSAGSVIMLTMLAVVLAGTALVLGRLSSGASVDLSRLKMGMLDIQDGTPADGPDEGAGQAAKAEAGGTKATAAPQPRNTPSADSGEGQFTLTMAGTVALNGEVRKNSKSVDSGESDYSDVMMLIAPQIRSDVNGVFVENLFSDSHKASDTTAPASAADLLKDAGFGLAACGFSQAYAHGADGIGATLMALSRRDIIPAGIRFRDDTDIPEMRNLGGVRTVFLQYTATISSKVRKSMEKDGNAGMVSEAEIGLITQDIAAARGRGAEAVIVLVNWGKAGKDPDKNQRALAEGIAQAGADLIVGNGSLVPQGAELLAGKNGKKVLCVWSLGSLLSGDRGNVKRMSGYLLHVTVKRDGQGGVEVADPQYTPVYTWKYKQDSRFYYRCVAADGTAPDGMDNEQRKNMAKAAEIVQAALDGSPVHRRGQGHAE